MESTFVETDCTVEHEGKRYTSGGACIVDCSDGYRRGVVYVGRDLGQDIVTDWHGNTIALARLGPVYRGNFCRMQSVSFTLHGVRYHGRYCPDWAQCVRIRSTKKV